MYLKLKFFLSLVTVFLVSSMFGWGYTPHAVIAYLGYKYSTPEVKAKIMPLLKSRLTLPSNIVCFVTPDVENADDFMASAVAPWPDSLRYIPVSQWGQAGSFAQNFYANCHFIDTEFLYGETTELPKGLALEIAKNQIFHNDGTSKDDLYYLYSSCIKTLAMSQNPATKDQISKDEQIFALRFLIHLSGDATQPLHMSDPMYKPEGSTSSKEENSYGGNTIYFATDYPTQKDGYSQDITELHELWDNPGDEFVPFISDSITDSCIFVDAKSAKLIKSAADSLDSEFSSQREAITANKDYTNNDLVLTWVTDTYIKAVANVCKGLGKVISYTTQPTQTLNKHGNLCIKAIPNTTLYVGCSEIETPTPAYLDGEKDIYRLQIYKGAVRLSDLLDAIYDPTHAPQNIVDYVNGLVNNKNVPTVNQLCQVYY